MAHASLRFYEELNDYLPADQRKRDIVVRFDPPCPLRHLIESLGVPHTEIEVILLNGRSVDLDARPADGDRVSVYPVFESLDVTPLLRLRPAPLREPRFFADAQLGRLARYLRMLGFDTLFEVDIDDADLVRRAVTGHRIILTRDRLLLMRRDVSHGCHIRLNAPGEQLRYVVDRCDLRHAAAPFSRCLECNTIIEPVDKQAVVDRLEPNTIDGFNEFWRCPGCDRIYWKGSHYDHMMQRVEQLLHQTTVDTA